MPWNYRTCVCFNTHQRDPEGHTPAFRKQQVPAGPPGAHVISHLFARLMNQEDGDSALQWSGAQPGAWNQQLTPHAVQLLQAATQTASAHTCSEMKQLRQEGLQRQMEITGEPAQRSCFRWHCLAQTVPTSSSGCRAAGRLVTSAAVSSPRLPLWKQTQPSWKSASRIPSSYSQNSNVQLKMIKQFLKSQLYFYPSLYC